MQIHSYLHKCKYNYLIYNCYTNTNNKYLRYFNNKMALFFLQFRTLLYFCTPFQGTHICICLYRYTLHMNTNIGCIRFEMPNKFLPISVVCTIKGSVGFIPLSDKPAPFSKTNNLYSFFCSQK